ncbi:hypothetical protein M0812_16490 [Anaeramoeba flamelloides]|uniref:PX domain-containing protein n=1 Tax=Anaeramoeba flamelloides TaxID=1746091 RepID=A0AAV7Z867_9EUKA|nr:hypothetical protein M0812_16490 [Anaeramoeba flamelloides]
MELDLDISHYRTIDKSYTEYKIDLKRGSETWCVWKRFSQFHSLSKVLKKKYQSKLPMPKKKRVGKLKEQVILSRVSSLNKFMKAILKNEKLKGTDEFGEFLELGKPLKGTWRERICTGEVPTPRVYPQTFIHNRHLYVFGGQDPEQNWLNDMYTLSMDEQPTWERVAIEGMEEVGEQKAHTIFSSVGVYAKKCFYYFGCYDEIEHETKTWKIDFANGKGQWCSWEGNKISKRIVSAAFHNEKIILISSFGPGSQNNNDNESEEEIQSRTNSLSLVRGSLENKNKSQNQNQNQSSISRNSINTTNNPDQINAFVIDLSTEKCKQYSIRGSLLTRNLCSFASLNEYMYIFGGEENEEFSDNLDVLKLGLLEFENINPKNYFEELSRHSSAILAKGMGRSIFLIISGGYAEKNNQTQLDQLMFCFDIHQMKYYRVLANEEGPLIRFGHSIINSSNKDDKILIFGGIHMNNEKKFTYLNDVWEFTFHIK